jgi:hypothetical protein
MRGYLIDFLRVLEQRIQPPRNCHHVITYAQYGSDDEGWNEKLAVQVNDRGNFYAFFIDDDDFSAPPDALAEEIAMLHAKQLAERDRQKSVALGQYAKP